MGSTWGIITDVVMAVKVFILYATMILLISSTKGVSEEISELMQKLALMNGKKDREKDANKIIAIDTDPNNAKMIMNIKEAFEERRRTLVFHQMEFNRLLESENLKIIQEKLEMLMSELYQPKATLVVHKAAHSISGARVLEMTLQHNNGYASLRFDAYSHSLKISSL